LISIKTMQNAYRNFTNRIEEAFGDLAVARLYRLPAAFGFFFFMLDGSVARGVAEQGQVAKRPGLSGGSLAAAGVPPYRNLIEEGGDYFRLSKLHRLGKAADKPRRRQDVIATAEQSLIDLCAAAASAEPTIHYDAIAFVPARVRRSIASPRSKADWSITFSAVDERLDFRPFLRRLVEAAEMRKLA
jgi:hypothetical protein